MKANSNYNSGIKRDSSREPRKSRENKEFQLDKEHLLHNVPNNISQKSHIPHRIDINRITNQEKKLSFAELIKCKICFNILVNPYDCETCGNSFCHSCINNLVINHKQCPFNCHSLRINPSSFGITTILSTLTFECIYKENGCCATIPYLDVINHDKECSFQTTICPNFKCNRSIKRQILEYHIRKECQYTLYKCENCEMNFIRGDYLQHVKNCKLVEDIFDLKTPIINSEDTIDLQEISMKNFMQILLYNLSKNNKEFNTKLSLLSEEVSSIKEVINRQTNNTIILIENLHDEIDYMNERLTRNDLQHLMNEKFVPVNTIIDDNLKQSVNLLINNTDNKSSSNNSSDYNSCSTANKSDINEINKLNFRNEKVGNIVSSAELLTKNNISVVKKIKIENKFKDTLKINTKGNKSPPARSPNQRTQVSQSPYQQTLYRETESSQCRTGNIAVLKSTLKNQEVIIENLNKISEHANMQENVLNKKMEMYSNELKDFIKFFLIEKNAYDY